jgi:uncharacterized membrane protein YcaP (DUF421 family)
VFRPAIPLLEILGRVLVIYLGLLLLTRLSGKREVGELSPMEFLSMLVLSETVSPALTRQDTSLGASLFAAACLIGISVVVGRLSYRSPAFQRLLEGSPTTLIRNGRVLHAALRREAITDEELKAALRKNGVEDPRRVRRATVERDGRISVVLRNGGPETSK